MVYKRRGRIEILMDILEEASSSVNKTKIVYGANLNFVMAERYLPLLIERELIVKVDGKKGVIYKTTEKGRKVLKDFRQITGSL